MVVKAPLALVESGMLPLVARLWRDWMRPHWRELTAIVAIVALLAGASSLYPVLIKTAFDAFDDAEQARHPAHPVRRHRWSRRSRASPCWRQTVLTNRVVTRIEADMQTALYGHLIDADLAQIMRETPAALTQRFTTDFGFISEALTRLSTVFLRDIATVSR